VWQNGALLKSGALGEKDVQKINTMMLADESLHLYLVAYSTLRAGESVAAGELKLELKLGLMKNEILKKLSVENARIHQRIVGPFSYEESSESQREWVRLFIYAQ